MLLLYPIYGLNQDFLRWQVVSSLEALKSDIVAISLENISRSNTQFIFNGMILLTM